MSLLRNILGAALGGAAAAVALRVRATARDRDAPVTDVLADLPGILAEDATRVADAARRAINDGRVAADAARIEFDEQVAARSRRTKGHDV